MKRLSKIMIATMFLSASVVGFSTAANASGSLCLVSATDGYWFLAKSSSTHAACGIAAKKVIPGHSADKISFGDYKTGHNDQNRARLSCKQGQHTVSEVGAGFVTEVLDALRNNNLTHCTIRML
jgi:hypothetical protein